MLMLILLLSVSIILTYVLPKGQFGVKPDGSPDYSEYIRLDNAGGIPILKGIFAPVLVFFSGDGISLVFLSLFIFSISASFYVMGELGGVSAIVEVVVKRFMNRRRLLLVIVSFLFYCFGAFLGLFEEVIVMLPIVCAVCLSIGFDSFTGFLCCILSCGFGFASAITNPFTVILASNMIGVSPIEHISFRFLIFAVMFIALQCFILAYVRKIKKSPESSLTFLHDAEYKSKSELNDTTEGYDKKKLVKGYTLFIGGSLVLIIVSSLSPLLRGITVVLLTAYTLLFGIFTGIYVSHEPKKVLGKTLQGFAGALPAIAFIAVAASIKYVFEEGRVLPTVIEQINRLTDGHMPLINALSIFVIVLVLEFFISSSTAKAFLVMGILKMANTGLTKPMLVLLYTFGDGYTNVMFPTSPVLLISLSMLDVEYFKWVRKSGLFFACTLLLVLGFIAIGSYCGY